MPRPSKLPTRVIDVGLSDEDMPRLVITEEQRARYATLSHRWGGNNVVALTKATLPALQQGFDPASFPQTFRDAISTTRMLGIRYLWIDTFCIIQDDGADWESESKQMGDIYEKAYLNIAATCAIDSTQGFLSRRRPPPTALKLPCKECSKKGCIIFTDQPESSFYSNVIQAPLNRRGWVFQERVLSRRTIHFAQDQLYWECGHHILSEDGLKHNNFNDAIDKDPTPRPGVGTDLLSIKPFNAIDTKTILKKHFDFDFVGPPTDFGHPTTDPLEDPKEWKRNLTGLDIMTYTGRRIDSGRQTNDPPEVSEEEKLHHVWMEVLRSYSSCQLSFGKDKLPAFHGLATKMSNLMTTKDSYICGHFMSSSESLMWRVCGDGGRATAPRCSSWSCLSVDAPVEFYNCKQTTPSFAIIWALYKPMSSEFMPCILSAPMSIASRGLENSEAPTSKPRHFSMYYMSKNQYGTFRKSIGPVVFDDPQATPDEFYCAPFYRLMARRSVVADSRIMTLNCLVLALQKTGKMAEGYDEFCRIGIGHVYEGAFFGDWETVTFALS
jgi:hypothetical protein